MLSKFQGGLTKNVKKWNKIRQEWMIKNKIMVRINKSQKLEVTVLRNDKNSGGARSCSMELSQLVLTSRSLDLQITQMNINLM